MPLMWRRWPSPARMPISTIWPWKCLSSRGGVGREADQIETIVAGDLFVAGQTVGEQGFFSETGAGGPAQRQQASFLVEECAEGGQEG